MGRLARLAGLTLVGAVAVAATLYRLLPFVAKGFVRGLGLLAAGSVWLATSISMGDSVWSVGATVWRTAMGALVTPVASAVLLGLVGVGGLALYWLQRLLGSEEE